MLLYNCSRGTKRKTKTCVAARAAGRRFIMAIKFCTKCGKKFESIGREVICPACKAQAAEESKRAAVLRAKRASWTGESVPVRISGRASTLIRRYGAANGLPFAQALDDLLKATTFFSGMQMAWEDITPYRSHRRDKHATETAQDGTQASKPQEVQAAKVAKVSKATKKAASASKAGKKA